MIRQNISLYVLIAAFFFLGATAITGQEKLPDEEIEVLKNFEAKLSEMRKIFIGPGAFVVDSASRKFEYEITLTPLALDYPPPYIRPKAMDPERRINGGYAYIKGGYGNLNNPLGIVRLNKSIENYYNIGLKFDYRAFEDEITTNKANKSYTGQLDIDYYLTNSTIAKVNMRGGKDEVHFYGFNRGRRLESLGDSVRDYTQLGLSLELINQREISDDEFRLYGNLHYDLINSSDLSIKEHDVLMETGLTKSISPSSLFTLKTGGDLSMFQDSITKNDHHFFVGGHFDIDLRNINLHIGGLAKSDRDRFHFFPDAEVDISAIQQTLFVKLGARGKLRKNSYKNIIDYNPYFNQVLDTLRSTETYDFYGSIRFIPTPNFSIRFDGGYLIQNQFAFYLNDPANPRQFAIIYDNLNSKYFSMDVHYRFGDQLEAGAMGSYHIYEPESEMQAWHLPEWKSKIYGQISLLNHKLTLKPEAYLQGKIHFIHLDGHPDVSNIIADLALQVQYNIFPNFSVFLEGKNLTNSLEERWYGYDSPSRHILAGGILKF